MLKRLPLLIPIAATMTGADLPIREVVLYKHGVGYFMRAGDLPAGETAQLAFKASDMNDVLKSLTITDASGLPIAGVRYDASEPLEQRLANFPFQVRENATLAGFLEYCEAFAPLMWKVGLQHRLQRGLDQRQGRLTPSPSQARWRAFCPGRRPDHPTRVCTQAGFLGAWFAVLP